MLMNNGKMLISAICKQVSGCTADNYTYISDIREGCQSGQRSQHGRQGTMYNLQEDNKNLISKIYSYGLLYSPYCLKEDEGKRVKNKRRDTVFIINSYDTGMAGFIVSEKKIGLS